MSVTLSFLRQSFLLGTPKFTAANVPDLSRKVIIVTGSNTGVGKEIAQIVYAKNANVYMMARSEEKARRAMDSIKSAVPKSTGSLTFIRLDLADLQSIKASAQEFLRRESELHVLFNNAGVAFPERGSKTKQGYELQLGVNALGTFALTQHLTPVLVASTKSANPGSVRVVWSSSSAAEAVAVKDFANNYTNVDTLSTFTQYQISKLANYLHSAEFAAQHKSDGLISVSLNPGNLDSDLWRTQGSFMSWFLRTFILYPSVYGAYTNLFAAFSPDVTISKSGSHVAPWGRLWRVSTDMVNATKSKAQGGSELATRFWTWSQDQVRPFL